MTTTITISDEMRRELLKVAAQLQASKGEKINYDDVLRFLVSKATRNLDLFHQACARIPVSSKELREDLRKGRAEDRKGELRLEQRYS